MKFNYLGIGAAGNKAAIKLINEGVADASEVFLVNSTDKDFPTEFKGGKIILKPDNTGCGKERSVAKEYATRSIKAGLFDNIFAEDVTNVVFVTSVEGGTGSGATPIIANYVGSVLNKNIHIVAFTGFEEDVRGLQNTVEFFQEISSFDADIMTIQLSAFSSKAKGNKFTAEEMADEEFCRRINIMKGSDLKSSIQNIDDTDIFKVVSTIGYKTIEEIKFDENLLDVEQFNKLCKQIVYQSVSLKTKEPGQLRLGVILNIKPESEDAVDYGFKVFKDAYGIPYECFFHKQYDGGQQYIRIISSGMKLPVDEVKEVYERYLAASGMVDKKEDTFFDQLSGLKISTEDEMFNLVGRKKSGVNKNDFLKSLETK